MSGQPRSGGPPPPPFEEEYICTGCGNHQIIKSTDPITCTQCQCRIFRKIATRARVQFVAR